MVQMRKRGRDAEVTSPRSHNNRCAQPLPCTVPVQEHRSRGLPSWSPQAREGGPFSAEGAAAFSSALISSLKALVLGGHVAHSHSLESSVYPRSSAPAYRKALSWGPDSLRIGVPGRRGLEISGLYLKLEDT